MFGTPVRDQEVPLPLECPPPPKRVDPIILADTTALRSQPLPTFLRPRRLPLKTSAMSDEKQKQKQILRNESCSRSANDGIFLVSPQQAAGFRNKPRSLVNAEQSSFTIQLKPRFFARAPNN